MAARVLILIPLLSGCATPGAGVGPPAPAPADYCLGCADVVTVRFLDRPEWDHVSSVGLDGSLRLGPAEVAAAGTTLPELHQAVAASVGVPAERVQVELTAARAGRVYLVGPENRVQQVLPYIGPEPVLHFLTRADAATPGCAELRAIHVSRPHVASGGTPETVWVNVAAIRRGDDATNVLLEPSDIVTVGETHWSRFARLLPAWAEPVFRRLACRWW